MTAVLRESSDTAALERLRLEAGAGHSRLSAALHQLPLRIRHLGSEEAAKSGLRYQPVAWTAIVVAAIAFFFPGRPEPLADAGPIALPPRAAVGTSPTTVPSATQTSPTTAPPPAATFTPAAPAFAPPAPSSPAFTPPPASSPTPSSSTSTSTPLSVVGWGWASSLSGTGLSTAGVPEGSLPVAARLGQLDKASFIRLSGTSTTLTLLEDPDGAREAVGAGAVVICAITEPGWAEEPDQSLDDAPAWDADSCIGGVEDNDTWTFDLSSFDDPAAAAGFALIPDAEGPPDFQVTFLPG